MSEIWAWIGLALFAALAGVVPAVIVHLVACCTGIDMSAVVGWLCLVAALVVVGFVIGQSYGRTKR
jgi:uncharacterized membrane protein